MAVAIALILVAFRLSAAYALSTSPLVTAEAIERIQYGQVAIIPDWLPLALVQDMRQDAQYLFETGQFQPDGLTNTALSQAQQGFTATADRQTFRGGAGWYDAVGNRAARRDFSNRIQNLRLQLARDLQRPTLATDAPRKHEMTYNYYQPGAKLGRHLDEHHEETKGTKGWMLPTRRSVTWLVYLNEGWTNEDGGALRTFPRQSEQTVGSHEENLQVGWLNHTTPVFLDSFRESGGSALYTVAGDERMIVSSADFEVPRQPIDFSTFLKKNLQGNFDQISTARLDPRFAGGNSVAPPETKNEDHLDVVPTAGSLVLFDSVVLPHLVQQVTANRPRIAATGWFHEDSAFFLR